MAASAAHSSNHRWYDFFLNHRGVDVKKTFARSLYLALRNHNLIAFLDQEELEPGYHFPSQIIDAIRTASVHVAIFSPNYADSEWCLKELVLMLESEAPIVPVFYRVTPAELRRTRGKYAESLQNLAKKKTHEGKMRYDSKTIENWREALSRAADYSGFELEVCNGKELELELLDKLVKCLSEKAKKAKPDLYVAEHPTGLEDKLKAFEATVMLQQHKSEKPHILGIVGSGGIGKTTLAKEFFNTKKSNYHRSCFLSNVRDAAKGSLTSLQRQLLKSLIGSDKPVDSVDEGQEMLRKPLQSSNALVILDDVDHVDQVKELLPVPIPHLCSGSLILITSRDKDVLRRSGVEKTSIYKLTELDTRHSRELFCSYAFTQAYPDPGYESLVDEFLKSCKGLPLSLKVFGSLLYGKKDMSEWKDDLENLQQILPEEIKKRLKISYDALDREEKHIFLDIACFFIGQNRDTAIEIWDRSDWKGRRGFQNLLNKSLVEVDSQNAIQMHDHLRDMGRDVAEELSSPCRIWRWTENVIDNLLQQSYNGKGITVRGIRMVDGNYNAQNALSKCILERLQILDTQGSHLEDILRTVELPNLIWFRWEKYPRSSLPSWVPIKNLRVLRVSHSPLLKTLCKSQAPLHLPICLEELWADGCVQLKSVKGLERSTKLRKLVVSNCSELEALPNIETLVSLEELTAERCVKLNSIQGLAQCTKLRLLFVDGCSELEALPNIGTLVSLEELTARDCVKLNSIQGLAQCTKLRLLFVDGCSELEALPNIGTLVSLEELTARDCVKLNSIQGLAQCTKLRLLFVDGCSELEALPNIETLESLEELTAERCVKLNSIQGLAQCTKLRLLYLEGCSELEALPNIGTLVSLEELRAKRCVKLNSIQGLAQCTKLRLLYLDGCSELQALPNMGTLVSLEQLRARDCVKLNSIQGLAQCTKLRLLFVDGCSELEALPNIETLVSLEQLTAKRCVKLNSIQGLAQCTKLRLLYLDGCSELEALPNIGTLVSLEDLRAERCVKLNSIQGLAQCTKLRVLFVDGCSELEALPNIGTLVSLEELTAKRCVKLNSIHGLAQCTKLRLLFVDGCSELEALPNIGTLVSLEELTARDCVKLNSIQGLAQCTKLRSLHLTGCSELEELPSMETSVSLEELWTDACVKLKSIRGLQQSIKLQKIVVSGCCELEEIPSMETLVSLEEFRANGCVKLKSISGLTKCVKLQRLHVRGCSELEEMEGVKHLPLVDLDVSACPKLVGV